MSFTLGLAQCRHPQDGAVGDMVDKWAARACGQGVDLLVFPESLMTPFELEGEDFARSAEPLDGEFCMRMNAIARKRGLWMIYTVNERSMAGKPYNTAVVVDAGGQVRGAYRKTHLFDTDFVRESDKVAAGDALMKPVCAPFGCIGLGICYDLRFPELARAAALAGCDVLVYPAAWVDGPGKAMQWKTLLRARAIENQVFVAGVSRCDRSFGRIGRDYAGTSCVFGPMGDELARAQGFQEELLVAEIDLGAITAARAAMPCLEHRRSELYDYARPPWMEPAK